MSINHNYLYLNNDLQQSGAISTRLALIFILGQMLKGRAKVIIIVDDSEMLCFIETYMQIMKNFFIIENIPPNLKKYCIYL
jgi:hypothetical protein